MGSIYVKNGEIQFWGSPSNPGHVGVAFSIACCPCGCWFYYDDFNDADTTTPPNFYEVSPSDWGISGFTLVEDYSTGTDGTANAKIICTQEQPADHAGEQQLYVEVSPETGDIYYLWLCNTSSTSVGGGVEVIFECTTAPSQWTVTIGTDSVNYTAVTANGLGFVGLGACVDADADMAKAWIIQSAEEGLWVEGATVGTGRYSAIGHNNIGHLNVFDNYRVAELRDSNGDTCDDCFCRCLGIAIPKELTLTVVDATGRASCAGGYTCTLTWEWNAGTSRWKGSYTVVNGASSQFFEWCLTCESAGDNDPSNPGQNFNLSLCSATGCASTWPSGSLTVWEPTSASTCAPLLLRFGPMTHDDSDLTCHLCYPPDPLDLDPYDNSGEYYIEVTL